MTDDEGARIMWQRAKRVKLALAVFAVSAGLSGCASRTSNVNGGHQLVVIERIDGPYVLAGTDFEVELEKPLGTDVNRPGDSFVARVNTPLRAPNGQEVVPAGARVMGSVV